MAKIQNNDRKAAFFSLVILMLIIVGGLILPALQMGMAVEIMILPFCQVEFFTFSGGALIWTFF